MNQVQLLDGLAIVYEDFESEKIDDIKKFIEKYSVMFSYFEKEDSNKKIKISEFRDLVESIVEEFTKDDGVKKLIESEDSLACMYLSYLILEKDKTNDTLIELPSNMTTELILFFLSLKYFDNEPSKICDILFSDNSPEMDNIINKLKDEQRENIYNYCLKNVANYIEEYEPSIYTNLGIFLDKLTQINIESVNILGSKQNKIDNLKQLSNDEFDTIFNDFLEYIKAPKEWFDTYKHLKNNNLIKYEYNDNEIYQNGECYFDKNDQLYKISLISDGTLKTFITFVHEFIHYISTIQNENISFSLLEFPSIYYENIAANFLKNSGYDTEMVDQLLKFRIKNNFDVFSGQILLFKDILTYKKNGTFSLEKRIKFYSDAINTVNEFKINLIKELKEAGIDEGLDFLSLDNRNPIEVAYNQIDNEIDDFVKSGALILNGYQYLIGSLLTSKILENEIVDNQNENMICVTNNLGKYSIDSILKLLSL